MSHAYATPVTLQGGLITLAPISLAHATPLFETLKGDEAIWEYLPTDPPKDLSQMEAVIEGALAAQARGERVPFGVIDNATGRAIGTTSYLNISVENRHLEIGWTWYGRDHWRSGVNTECKYLLLRRAFEDLGCIRVQLRTDERNQRSRNAIERIGGVLEGIAREDRIIKGGFHRSSAQYSLLAGEWPARKAWFEERLAVAV
jgi:RimJ/RimL family protein N-acetyltransferase